MHGAPHRTAWNVALPAVRTHPQPHHRHPTNTQQPDADVQLSANATRLNANATQ
jgi:hypothetical protein